MNRESGECHSACLPFACHEVDLGWSIIPLVKQKSPFHSLCVGCCVVCCVSERKVFVEVHNKHFDL